MHTQLGGQVATQLEAASTVLSVSPRKNSILSSALASARRASGGPAPQRPASGVGRTEAGTEGTPRWPNPVSKVRGRDLAKQTCQPCTARHRGHLTSGHAPCGRIGSQTRERELTALHLIARTLDDQTLDARAPTVRLRCWGGVADHVCQPSVVRRRGAIARRLWIGGMPVGVKLKHFTSLHFAGVK